MSTICTPEPLDNVPGLQVDPTTLQAIKMKADYWHNDQTCQPVEVRGLVPDRFKSVDRSGRRVYHVRKGDEGLLFKPNKEGNWCWVIFVREGESIHAIVPTDRLEKGALFRHMSDKLKESSPIPASQVRIQSGPSSNSSKFEHFLRTFLATLGNRETRGKLQSLGLPGPRCDMFFSSNTLPRMINAILSGMCTQVRQLLDAPSWTVQDLLRLPKLTKDWPPVGSGIYLRVYTNLDGGNATKFALYVGQSVSMQKRHQEHNADSFPGAPGSHYLIASRSHPNNRHMIPLIFKGQSQLASLPEGWLNLAEQVMMGAFATYHQLAASEVRMSDAVKKWETQSCFLHNFTMNLRQALGLPAPTWLGCNRSSPLFQYENGVYDINCVTLKSTNPSVRNRSVYRKPTVFRANVNKQNKNTVCGANIKYRDSKGSHTLQILIQAHVVEALRLPMPLLCYLVFEIMEDGKTHEQPWLGCPKIGPFRDFERAASLGIRVEYYEKQQSSWRTFPIQSRPNNWPALLRSRNKEDAIKDWRRAILLIQMLECVNYVGTGPERKEMDGFEKSPVLAGKRIMDLKLDHLRQTARWQPRAYSNKNIPQRTRWADNERAMTESFAKSGFTMISSRDGPPPRDSAFWKRTPEDVKRMGQGTIRCDTCFVSKNQGSYSHPRWECTQDTARQDVWVCVCCSALNRPCTFSAISTVLANWGTQAPHIHPRIPLSMFCSTDWRFLTFYRDLTTEDLQTAKRMPAAPFEGLDGLLSVEGEEDGAEVEDVQQNEDDEN